MELVEAGYSPREEWYDLKTVEGGRVQVRRMNHGESNEFTDLRMSFIPMQTEEDSEESGARARTTVKLSRHYSFSRFVLDHNLGKDGRKFDFKKRRDVDDLDAAVGDEIAQLIDDHNESPIESQGGLPNSEES